MNTLHPLLSRVPTPCIEIHQDGHIGWHNTAFSELGHFCSDKAPQTLSACVREIEAVQVDEFFKRATSTESCDTIGYHTFSAATGACIPVEIVAHRTSNEQDASVIAFFKDLRVAPQ